MKNWIVLVDHTRAASHVIHDLRARGLKIFFLGLDKVLQQICDDFIAEDPTQNTEAFLDRHGDRLMKLGGSGVYTLLEHAKHAEAQIAHYLGKSVVSDATLGLSRDKHLMRKLLSDSPLEPVKFQFFPDGSDISAPVLNYPFIVKPNSGFASGGVQLVHSLAEFQSAAHVIRRLNRFVLGKDKPIKTGILCEEFIRGPEFSVDSLTVNGVTRTFCICGRGFLAEENYQDYLYYTSPELPERQTVIDVQSFVGDFLSRIGLENGPSHTEIRWDLEKKTWKILESGLRVGFAGNIGKMIEAVCGVPYNFLALKAHLGQLAVEDLERFSAKTGGFGFVFTPSIGTGGVIRNIRGPEFLKSNPQIIFYEFLKQIGDAVVPYPKGLEYLGVIIGTASSRVEQQRLAAVTAQEVEFLYAK